MVNGYSMLISEFARRAGLSTDTVRYYVRIGLLQPETGSKGGGNPYQLFTAEHLLAAKIIRTAQALGMPLKEIATISAERRAARMTPGRSVQILRTQLERLETKATALRAMSAYLGAKIEWLEGGEKGPPPDFPETGPSPAPKSSPPKRKPSPTPDRRSML
jgi:DNA-binding transcriptional MerR regulator